MKKKFRVMVEETLVRIEEIEAVDEDEAISIAKQMYRDEEIILTGDDFNGDTSFTITNE